MTTIQPFVSGLFILSLLIFLRPAFKMRLIDTCLSLLIPGLILVHLLIAPYTKVEESFNIQATHDVLVYGTPTSDINHKLSSSYDHFTFPGAVPRTFIGPVLLAGISQPLVTILGFEYAQLIVRAVLGLFNSAALLIFASNLRRAYGSGVARWYLVLQASQFHVIFYASRTLPNMFAFGLTTLAFGMFLPHPNPKSILPRQRLGIALFVFAAVVFRSEIALLLATSALYLLIVPAISLEQLIPPFVISFLVALLVSVPVDSYFWQKPLWPELWGFYYNAILGISSDWGVSPWHYYFTSAIPRLLVNPLTYMILIPISLRHPALAPAGRRLVIPSLLFIAIYSLQPHKEARFIFYVVPPLTAAAALGANFISNRFSKSIVYKLLTLALIVSVLVSFVASSAMLLVSSLNYPGGEALAYLRDNLILQQPEPISSGVIPVHADVLACMTGVTLFGTATTSALPSLHNPPNTGGGGGTGSGAGGSDLIGTHGRGSVKLALDKTEDETTLARDDFWTRFDYILSEDPQKVTNKGRWETVGVVKGLGGVEVQLTPNPTEKGEGGEDEGVVVVGKGALVEQLKQRIEKLTGGRWIGPRAVPRIYILRRIKESSRRAVDA
ncbi:hypothetical protein QBC46DRAFT_364677 [Diplogelasinospora grovesii]|uniref:Mannosyltransferase n=1 Tax=Diplogelasinospora grovesii TaxID=303347 RepID=A0AAN6S4I3_9PEZI|nr:hypothetical protein QBC46DRAFT_364677 [Diplogelasinospora grovesii]